MQLKCFCVLRSPTEGAKCFVTGNAGKSYGQCLTDTHVLGIAFKWEQDDEVLVLITLKF